jgi:O-antigen ligase
MKYLERIYPWLLVAPILLPVVVWSGLVYPYLVPKTLLFYALSFITIGIFGILASSGRAFYWNRLTRWEAWVPGLLLALAYGTSLIGTDFYRSFWSLFIRGDGLLMLTCAVASFYFIVLSADQTLFKRLLYGASSIGSLVALYGIGEWFIEGGRIGSLLGNAAFFAGYLGITLFATLALLPSLLRGRWAALVAAGLQVVAITLTATRGTILALLVALVAWLVYLTAIRGGKHRTRAALALGTILVCGGVFLTFRSELAHVPFAPISRIAAIGSGDADVASRLFIWKNMLGEIGKSPWTGVGAEHIDTLFNRFYDPTLISEQWFDRSHNAFLDYAAQYGIGGLILYLALISIFFMSAWRLGRRGEQQYAAVAALLAVTYAVQNFFVFDTVSSFWLMLALLAVFYVRSLTEEAPSFLPMPVGSRPAAWAVAAGLVLLIVPVSIRPLQAAHALAEAYQYQITDVAKEADYLSHGFALGTYGDLEYGYQAYDMYVDNQLSRLTGQDLTDAYEAARSILEEDFYRYPYDARTALYLAHVLAVAPEPSSVDQELFSSALERAIRLSPKRSQPWYILTNASLTSANQYPVGSKGRADGYRAARELLTRYIALVPTLAQPYYVLAQLEFASDNRAAASEAAAKGKQYYKEDLETARRAAVYYENTLDLPNAAYFLTEVLREDPTDAGAASDLAQIKAYESKK